MAEQTALRNNALDYPVYGVPWGVTFPILDADGDLVTGAAGLDSEISQNGNTFGDCTNEATEIATSSGMYYLLLTGTEMTADVVTGIVKTSTVGAKTTPFALITRKLPTVRSGTAQAGAAGTITLDSGASGLDDYYNGCLIVATLDGAVEARIITDYVGSTKVASVTPDWNTTPDSDDTFIIKLTDGVQVKDGNTVGWLGTIPATPSVAGVPEVDITHIGGDAQSATDLKDFADAGYDPSTNKVQGVVLVDTLTTYTGNTPQTGDNFARLGAPAGASVSADIAAVKAETASIQTDTNDIQGRLPAALVSGRIDASVGAMAANVMTAAATAADYVTELQAGLALEATAQSIKAKTDNLPADPADESNVLAAIAGVLADTDNIQTRLPAALVGGRMDSDVGAMQANTLSASALATDAVNEIVAAVFARAFSAAYGGLTFDQIMKVLIATQAAKTSGGGTATFTIRNLNDSADVIVASVDADGNRSVVTITP